MHAIAKLDVKASADINKIAKLYMRLVIAVGCVETETWETRVTQWCACNDQRCFGNDILQWVRAETVGSRIYETNGDI
jgi:hypothetical protein